MQRGYIHINEATPTGLHERASTIGALEAQQAVTIDLSAGVAGLDDPETCYGWAYSKTIEHLGLEGAVEPPADGLWGRLRVEGTVDDVRANIPNLSGHIGLIARYGSERSGGYSPSRDREWIGRKLGVLTRRKLPEMPEGTSLMRAMGIITAPFADATIDDGLTVYYARGRSTVVHGEDGKPLGPYSVRDIGGLEVGQDGLPARNKYQRSITLPKDDLKDVRALATVRESSVGIELGAALDGYLSDQDRVEAEPCIDPDATRFSTSFQRTDLERMHELVRGFRNIKGSDVVRTATRAFLESLDPETKAQVNEERNRADAAQRKLLAAFGPPRR